MALDQKYFDDINIDVVKKNIITPTRSTPVLEDIREQAPRLEEENRNLRERLNLSAPARRRSATRYSPRKPCPSRSYPTPASRAKKLLNDSRLKAKQIIAAAQEKKEHLLAEAAERQEYCVRQAEKAVLRHARASA